MAQGPGDQKGSCLEGVLLSKLDVLSASLRSPLK